MLTKLIRGIAHTFAGGKSGRANSTCPPGCLGLENRETNYGEPSSAEFHHLQTYMHPAIFGNQQVQYAQTQ